MSDLPPGVFEALTRIAEGRGRTPTYAHPWCRCSQPYRPTCQLCGASPDTPCRPVTLGGHVIEAEFHGRQSQRATAADCPVHRKAKP